MPTTSAVRRSLISGRPITGPVSASISSTVSFNFFHGIHDGHHAVYTDTVGDECRRVSISTVVLPQGEIAIVH